MEPATPQGETPAPVAPSNEPGNTNTPPQVTVSADVEAAKREAEQAKIRANQLANEKKALEDKLAEVERKKLEEKEEFKTLYEQTNARLAEREAADAAKERSAELTKATEAVYAEYPSNVVELAKTAGLSLSDDSEEAAKALKEKLEVFKSKVGPSAPSANNPRPVTPEVASREEQMKRIRGGDKAALGEFIRSNPGIQRMKEIAQNGA
jgi:chromosome segregation ATPase